MCVHQGHPCFRELGHALEDSKNRDRLFLGGPHFSSYLEPRLSRMSKRIGDSGDLNIACMRIQTAVAEMQR